MHPSIFLPILLLSATAILPILLLPCYCPATAFPQHTHSYGFASPSTLKPTQWRYPGGSINQIPGEATICGDVRVTPFYDLATVSERGMSL